METALDAFELPHIFARADGDPEAVLTLPLALPLTLNVTVTVTLTLPLTVRVDQAQARPEARGHRGLEEPGCLRYLKT